MTLFHNKSKAVALSFLLAAATLLTACTHKEPTGVSFSGEVRWSKPATEDDILRLGVFHGVAPKGADLFRPLGQAQEILLEAGSTRQSFEITLDKYFLDKCKLSNDCKLYARIGQMSAEADLLSQEPLLLALKTSSQRHHN